jgi:AcrR family transcriptional regulator
MAANLKDDFTRYDQKLEFILQTSARIFAEKGFHSTSMRDISRASKVSLAGLYYYCKSKDELLFMIQDNCFGRVLERLERRLPETRDAADKLRVFIENHLSFFAANMAEMKVMSHESESLNGDLHSRVSQKKDRYTRLARKILGEVEQSLPKEARGIDLTIATYALFGMTTWIYNWYDPNGKLKVPELAENMTRLFLNGFANSSNESWIRLAPSAQTDRVNVWREP